MKRFLSLLLSCLFCCLTVAAEKGTSTSAFRSLRSEKLLAGYFQNETHAIQSRCLSEIHSLADWEARRDEYRRELQEMLGLWPMPDRTDLKPVITGTLEREDFKVEKLYFQASPHLYVTANLYLPRHLDKPAPAILYVCGHSRVATNGVSCGNKAGYQHHGAWFARNGYVCLLIDTLQLGEIEGLHHGTYRENQWWWNSRGYTPAGVEAWFGIRALDYLCSRPEVDKERIGMTGRSGGGSYTWTVAALDDRVKVAAPVAGITDLQNQVVDGAVEGHCDCMFFLNTYRWDFPQVAALLAPRPLLIGNSDKDTIFPLDGVVRLHAQVRRIYQLYGETNRLGLLITEGPHSDTQDLQVPVFRWFNRFLKGDSSSLIEMAAKPFFSPLELRVLGQLPADQINTRIQEMFVPQARTQNVVEQRDAVLAKLREEVFAGWPDSPAFQAVAPVTQRTEKTIRCTTYELSPQPGVAVPLLVLQDRRVISPKKIVLKVLDAQTVDSSPANPLWSGWGAETLLELRQRMRTEHCALAFFAPRGVERATWVRDPKQAIQVRRRYMLLGQTLDSMRVWDIRCAVQALTAMPRLKNAKLTLESQGEMGVNSAYAALFEPTVAALELEGLPHSHLEGPDYLKVLKVMDIPQALDLLGGRAAVKGK